MTQGSGALLRQWRVRRRLSQLELSSQTGVSTRHLSFVETGRSSPSRDLVLRLSAHLDVPLRERNHLLIAAGFAPEYRGTPLDDPSMAAVRAALRVVLDGHGPNPALVVDRSWNLVEANAAVAVLLGDVDPALLEPPVNVLRVAMHPSGMAPHIANLAEWRAHALDRVRRQVAATGDRRARPAARGAQRVSRRRGRVRCQRRGGHPDGAHGRRGVAHLPHDGGDVRHARSTSPWPSS